MPAERKSPDPGYVPSPQSSVNQIGGLAIGALVGERYQLEAMLGRGGMGIVFAALHVHTKRRVALKLIHCPWDDETLALYRRFLGEARAASAVRHPNVVDVLDMGYHGSVPYLVMERLTGESLEQVLERVPLVPLEAALAWLLPVMGALAVLHDKGIVHRDIKPSNIFLARNAAQSSVPKLLDFGLAQAVSEAPLTEPGVMLGTPEYMAPERARGQSVGPSADIWAMGVVLFECLCGRGPFTATTLNGIAAQIVAGEVLKTGETNPQLPAQVAAVIDRALATAPADRHRDMASFAYELTHAANLAGVPLPEDPDPVGLPAYRVMGLRRDAWASGPLAVPRQVATQLASSQPSPARRWLGRIALPSICLLMLGAGVLSWTLLRGADTRRAPPPSVAPRPQAAAPETPHAAASVDARGSAREQNTDVARPAQAEPAPSPSPVQPQPEALPAHAEPPRASPAPGLETRRRPARPSEPAAPTSKRVPVQVEHAGDPRPAVQPRGEFEKEWM